MGNFDKIVNLCKNRGFVFPGSEIYDGLANTMLVGRFVKSIRNFRKLEETEAARNVADVIVDESEIIEGEYKEL